MGGRVGQTLNGFAVESSGGECNQGRYELIKKQN